MDNLKLLQYDMLYGEQYVYGGINPITEKTDLRMGTYDISITDVYEEIATPEEDTISEEITSTEESENLDSAENLEKVQFRKTLK